MASPLLRGHIALCSSTQDAASLVIYKSPRKNTEAHKLLTSSSCLSQHLFLLFPGEPSCKSQLIGSSWVFCQRRSEAETCPAKSIHSQARQAVNHQPHLTQVRQSPAHITWADCGAFKDSALFLVVLKPNFLYAHVFPEQRRLCFLSTTDYCISRQHPSERTSPSSLQTPQNQPFIATNKTRRAKNKTALLCFNLRWIHFKKVLLTIKTPSQHCEAPVSCK